MNHHYLPALLLLGLLLCTCGQRPETPAAENNQPPNVLFIAVDDLRPAEKPEFLPVVEELSARLPIGAGK